MEIREPRASWTWFLWLWAALFGGIPLMLLVMGAGSGDGPPAFLLLFPVIAVAVLVPMTRRTLQVGFTLAEDGIHGAHDAEDTVLPWDQVERITWRWAEETSGVKVNGRPLPDGYALHAELTDGRAVRLMQRVAPKYGQQQDLNEQMARARNAGALPVPFTARRRGRHRNHTTWHGGDLPPAGGSPLGTADGPVWPNG